MVTRNAVNIWSQVRDRVRNELDNPNYDYLLEGTQPIEVREDSLIVGVPSQFARDWLDARLLPDLEHFCTQSPVGPYASSSRWLMTHRAKRETDQVKKAAQPVKQREIPGQQRPSFQAPASEATKAAAPQSFRGVYCIRLHLDTFVVEQVTVCACRGASGGRRTRAGYNPLFLYGGVGLGKTHLMHAIATMPPSVIRNYKM